MINLNAKAVHPTEKDANGNPLPYFEDRPMALWLAEHLEGRITTDNPILEARIASELRTNGTFTATSEELTIIRNIVILAQVDNLFKGQILSKLL